MEKLIIPAIIAEDQEELNSRINKVKDSFSILQLDIMDGEFVLSNSINFEFTLPGNGHSYEAHLMISDPLKWIKKNAELVQTIIFHIEACKNLKDAEKIVDLVKKTKKKVGIAINPKTSVSKIKPLLNKLDKVLVMTVNPGYYGSEFLPETLKKVEQLRKLKGDLDIEVDGGMNYDTIRKAYEAGANVFVCGSYLQKSENIKEVAGVLRNEISDI